MNLLYNTDTDAAGRTLYCFSTFDGKESPTLHVSPGDHVVINVKNNLPNLSGVAPMKASPSMIGACGDLFMTGTSVNLHFHGTALPPTCHSDEVIHTLVNAGSSFEYDLKIPADQPPGLYWYHPHVHGLSDAAVLGGASGAIIVDGIQNEQAATAKLPERVLVVRDQIPVPINWSDPNQPSWDLSLNYVPIPYPAYPPATIEMAPQQKQLWRVLNASADAIVDLQLRFDGKAQALQVVALDGVPLNSGNASRRGSTVGMKRVYLGPASRAEFIVDPPAPEVREAALITLGADTGPQGDVTPPHRIAVVRLNDKLAAAATGRESAWPSRVATSKPMYSDDLATVMPTAHRTLFFSETPPTPGEGEDSQTFFITPAGGTPKAFDPSDDPAITTTQGSVEDWTIENHAPEVHEFHIHQIHFLLMARDGVPVPHDEQQYLDEVPIPYYRGSGPYPNVTVRMDFRGPLTGDFLYHCHILDHEDNGMMAVLRVLPRGAKK